MKYAVVLVFSSLLVAQQDRRPPVPYTVQATGEATISVKPDQVRIDIGVVSEATNAQAAAEQNAQQLTTVLGELKKLIGKDGEVETLHYSVNPKHRHDRGTAQIVGYTASNTVRVTLRNLDLASKVIDAGTKSGANTINSVLFGLGDPQAARAQALKPAAAQGRKNAEAMAGALGLKVLRVLSAEEVQSPPFVPMRAEMAMQRTADAAPTPMEPGMVEIRAQVTVTLEVAP